MVNGKKQSERFESIHLSAWPTYDEKAIVHDVVNLAVQVNGKLRAVLRLDQDSPKDEKGIRELAMKDPRITNMCHSNTMPFDVKRMAYGGFETLVKA